LLGETDDKAPKSWKTAYFAWETEERHAKAGQKAKNGDFEGLLKTKMCVFESER
jgi:hypothetical protein